MDLAIDSVDYSHSIMALDVTAGVANMARALQARHDRERDHGHPYAFPAADCQASIVRLCRAVMLAVPTLRLDAILSVIDAPGEPRPYWTSLHDDLGVLASLVSDPHLVVQFTPSERAAITAALAKLHFIVEGTLPRYNARRTCIDDCAKCEAMRQTHPNYQPLITDVAYAIMWGIYEPGYVEPAPSGIFASLLASRA